VNGASDSVAYNDTNPADGPGSAAGILTAWDEQRQTAPAPQGIEVDALAGLGTVLYPTVAAYTAGLGSALPGRLEFEDFQAVSILLGSGGSTVTIGGDALINQLPLTRQEKVLRFVNTPTAMVSVTGGSGPDTVRLISTNQLTTTALDTALAHPVNVVTSQAFSSPSTPEQQHLTISHVTGMNGYFSLTYQYQHTNALPF